MCEVYGCMFFFICLVSRLSDQQFSIGHHSISFQQVCHYCHSYKHQLQIDLLLHSSCRDLDLNEGLPCQHKAKCTLFICSQSFQLNILLFGVMLKQLSVKTTIPGLPGLHQKQKPFHWLALEISSKATIVVIT